MESKKDLVIQLYSLMARIHLFELKLTEVSRLGVMPGFFHLCIGEEDRAGRGLREPESR